MKRNLPNILTGARIFLALNVAVCVVMNQLTFTAVLFAIAALTDFFDGFTARRLNLQSEFGEKFDPIADKILMTVVLLALGATGAAPAWFVGLVIGRDVVILAGSLWVAKVTGVRRFPPTFLGKLSTCGQVAAVVAILLAAMTTALWPLGLMLVTIVASTLLTLASGADYVRIGVNLVRTHAVVAAA